MSRSLSLETTYNKTLEDFKSCFCIHVLFLFFRGLCFGDVACLAVQSVLSGLTLEQCLEAYTREETLEEEDSWYCSSCRAHRRGIMKIDLWKMPDVLVRIAEHNY